jgi:glyoxylase-like metal-dependent hydrolase (beta-lactamase superfamily II)
MGAIKGLFYLVVVLVVIAGGGLMGMRAGRNKFSPATEIQSGVYGVRSAGGTYLYGARTGHNVVLFDTGADPAGAPVDGLLGALGAGRDDVKDIFLTHGHFDHLAGAGQFPDAHTYLGAADLGLASGAAAPDALAIKLLTLAAHPHPVAITHPLNGRETIPVGDGKTVKAFPVPGHTPGSFAFLYDGVLFPGDIMIYKEGRLETTPAIFDAHPEENRSAIRSLKTQLVADTVDTICTAHGGCTPKGLGRNLLDDLLGRLGG